MSCKIAMLSFADIDNFGDILFSYVFEKEVRSRIEDVSIDYYTPTDFIHDGRIFNRFDADDDFSEYDAMVLAGGEVVHFFDERTWMPLYEKKGVYFTDRKKPSDIVWKFCEKSEVPFKAWLSVGVRPCEGIIKGGADKAIALLDYISVRGVLSKKVLERFEYNKYNGKINVTPDLGWLFPGLIKNECSSFLSKEVVKFVKIDKPYVIFQANAINEEDCELICSELIRVKRECNVNVYLLPVIKPWEDDKYLDKIERMSCGEIKSLGGFKRTFDKLCLILNAKAVVSGSLHCALTALAAGIPAAIINKWEGTKLQDIFSQQFRMEFLSSDYRHLYAFYRDLMQEPQGEESYLECTGKYMRVMLSKTFDDLASNIMAHKKRR